MLQHEQTSVYKRYILFSKPHVTAWSSVEAQLEQSAIKTSSWGNVSRYWDENVIKEVMTIMRYDNGGVVMLEKVFF